MAKASGAVLGGFHLRSEAKVFRYPDHYQDERGARMWSIVWAILEAYIRVPMGSIVAE
jgi:DNA polymerase I